MPEKGAMASMLSIIGYDYLGSRLFRQGITSRSNKKLNNGLNIKNFIFTISYANITSKNIIKINTSSVNHNFCSNESGFG